MLDTVVEDFEGGTADATIDGVGDWTVSAGAAANALVQSGVTGGGTGKALKLAGASTPVTARRDTSFGGVSPTWVRLLARPGLGGERRASPSSGIASVSFDHAGTILASDGTAWVDTGQVYTADTWWEVICKLNFTNHTYDLYLSPLASPKTSFTPVKTGLDFTDATQSALDAMSFGGCYSATLSDDSYLDDLMVYYVEKIEFVSAAQTLVQELPSGPVTVQLQNGLGEPQRAMADLTLELKSTSVEGKFSLQREPWKDVAQALIPKDSSSVSFYYKDGKVGKPTLSVKEFPDKGWLEGLQQQKVVSKLAHFEVLAVSPQVAGAPFLVTLNARNEEGQPDESYGGTVTLTATYISPTGGTLQLTPKEAGGFSKGKLELSLIYPDAGAIQIEAADKADPSKVGSSGQILFLPARFQVEAAAVQVVGRSFPLTVTALNTDGGITPNYQGPANLSVRAIQPAAGAGALTPAAAAAGDFQGGKATLQVSYPRWGTVEVTAVDAASPATAGVSSPLMFHPEAIRLRVIPPPPPRDFFYTEEVFQVEVKPLGAEGASIPNYEGTVTLSVPSGLNLPAQYTFAPTDAGLHTFSVSAGAAGSYTLQAGEPASKLESSPVSLTVKQATLKVVPTVAPIGGVAEVTVLLVDETGAVIQTENNAVFTVKLVEASPNESVSSSALTQTVTITQGKATFLISNTEAESVTVVPTSLFGIKSQSGVVNFGRFATKGVGVLLWREVRESPDD